MSPLVSVPVLSLQRTSMLPKFSIASRCLTITFWRAMCAAPRERVTALIHGQELGRQAHRERHREEQRFEKRVMQERAGQKHEENEEEHRAHDEERELAGAPRALPFRRAHRPA